MILLSLPLCQPVINGKMINSRELYKEECNFIKKSILKNDVVDITSFIAWLADLLGIERPILIDEENVESDHFAYYWERLVYILEQVEATDNSENYEEFWQRNLEWINGGWRTEPAGYIFYFGCFIALLDFITLLFRVPTTGLGTAAWMLLGLSFVIALRSAVTIIITKNMYTGIETKEIDMLIRLIDENDEPIILNRTRNDYYPTAINNDIFKTNLFQDPSTSQFEKNEIVKLFTYKFNHLNNIDYPPNDEEYDFLVENFPFADGMSNFDGWYALSSRMPNPAYILLQYPAPPGFWNITIPDLIDENGKRYHGKVITTNEIISHGMYLNTSVKLIENISSIPYLTNESPVGLGPNNNGYDLNPNITFNINDIEGRPLLVEVSTNASDGINWIPLIEKDYYEEGFLFDIQTQNFTDYNQTYYWRVYLEDLDGPNNIMNYTYSFKTRID